jgi:hypothetical protein
VVFAGSKFLEHKLVTGADGRFEFRELGEDRARVDLKIERGFTQAIDGYATLRGGSVAAGTNNHTVVVVRTTFISGSIAGVAAGTRAVYGIEVLDQAGQWLRGISVLWEKGGAFTIRNCPPGKYDVGFSPRPGLAAIRKVEGVVVDAGKSCADPRLRGVDLSR